MKGRKNIRSLFLRRIAVLISICYLLGPLHQPMNTFLHFVSHQLEAPAHILSHENDLANHGVNDDEAHGMLVNQETHDHQIIDLLESFLKTSNSEQPIEDSFISKVQIDKHKVEFYELVIHPIVYTNKTTFDSSSYLLLSGYQRNVDRPPASL